jgi:hypothetical protein
MVNEDNFVFDHYDIDQNLWVNTKKIPAKSTGIFSFRCAIREEQLPLLRPYILYPKEQIMFPK